MNKSEARLRLLCALVAVRPRGMQTPAEWADALGLEAEALLEVWGRLRWTDVNEDVRDGFED